MWGLQAALPVPLSATLSLALSVYLQECGSSGSASGQTACLVRPTLHQSRSRHSHVSLLRQVPVSAPPTGLDECLFFTSWVLDFLAVRFSVSSGCARRRSVSTYTAILVLYLFSNCFRVEARTTGQRLPCGQYLEGYSEGEPGKQKPECPGSSEWGRINVRWL